MKKFALALMLVACSPAQTSGVIAATPACVQCASQIVQAVTADQRAKMCLPRAEPRP